MRYVQGIQPNIPACTTCRHGLYNIELYMGLCLYMLTLDLNVPLYLLSLHVHGPRFNTPQENCVNFEFKLVSMVTYGSFERYLQILKIPCYQSNSKFRHLYYKLCHF